MKGTFRTIAIILLLFNGISAIGGGIGLICNPIGGPMGMPLSMLEHTPFDNFLIPGIILLVMNGLLSILFAILVIWKAGGSSWLVIIQGCILLGWLFVEMAMIREYAAVLHTLYLFVGAGLVVSGILMRTAKN